MRLTSRVPWSVVEGVGELVLDSPDNGNAFSSDFASELGCAIDALLDAKPRAVLIRARGAAFCVGGDINEFERHEGRLDLLVEQVLGALERPVHRLATVELPTVCAVNGAVGGAGIALALCADFVLASTRMKLATGYARLGLSPDLGASYFLAQRVGPVRAAQWLMLSEPVDAAGCLAAGAVDSLHSADELEDAARRLVRRLADGASGSMRAIKSLVGSMRVGRLSDHMAREKALLLKLATGSDAIEGVRAFRERRAARFRGT